MRQEIEQIEGYCRVKISPTYLESSMWGITEDVLMSAGWVLI